jgi:hypothetical protein
MATNLAQGNGKKQSQRILLIGGAMRSGTTVIHRALCTARNSNPYISESWFLHDIMHLYSWNLSRYEVRCADQFGSEKNFSELIRMNIEYYLRILSARYQDPEVLVLKHPELTRHFATLAEMFPEMLFLAIVRDPRDVIASIKESRDTHLREGVVSPVSRLTTMTEMCRYYLNYYSRLIDAPSLKDRLMFVRYEDVMRDPAASIGRIGQFCGADYDPEKAVAFNEEHAASKNFDKELRLKDNLSGAFWSDLYTKDLSPERIGRYASTLDPDEVKEIEGHLRPFANHFGYWK